MILNNVESYHYFFVILFRIALIRSLLKDVVIIPEATAFIVKMNSE
jgi:hypothetical protein